ncbi:MAG: mechanosensitive ion channel domain-containing protein [Phormidesmis sp.]
MNVLEKNQSALAAPFFRLGGAALSLSAVAQVMLILLIALLFSFGLRRFLSLHVLSRLGLQQGTRESVAVITSYALATLLGIVLLQAIGINLASLAVVASSLGVGIGFGLREITKNFISGIALLVERKLKVGDFVETENVCGYISEISLRSTVIRTIAVRV